MTLQLPKRPAKHCIEQVLVPEWDASVATGYDPSVQPGDDAFVPLATSLDNVGAQSPSLVVQYSNETTAGQSTYDYITPDGPGQERNGTLLAIARAEDGHDDEYTGDPGNASPVTADDITVALIDAVEDACQAAAAGGQSEFASVGSQRGPDAPDDTDVSPTVRMANCQINYTWLRMP